MRLVGNIFWVVITLVFTFLWIVLFEHGFSGFQEGISTELENLQNITQPAEKRDEPELP